MTFRTYINTHPILKTIYLFLNVIEMNKNCFWLKRCPENAIAKNGFGGLVRLHAAVGTWKAAFSTSLTVRFHRLVVFLTPYISTCSISTPLCIS